MRAAAIAQDLGAAITLISAPDAVSSLGPTWFRNIVRSLEQAYPDVDMEAVLDCGDAAGYALAALRAGVKTIRFSGRPTTAKKIDDMAGTYGARLVKLSSRVLDPRREREPEAALRNWIGNGLIDKAAD